VLGQRVGSLTLNVDVTRDNYASVANRMLWRIRTSNLTPGMVNLPFFREMSQCVASYRTRKKCRANCAAPYYTSCFWQIVSDNATYTCTDTVGNIFVSHSLLITDIDGVVLRERRRHIFTEKQSFCILADATNRKTAILRNMAEIKTELFGVRYASFDSISRKP